MTSPRRFAKIQNHPAKAVERLCRLKDLSVSFASKHLKFLAPERAVVLDSVVAGLGYTLTPSGYAELLADCDAMLAHICSRAHPLSVSRGGNVAR